MSSVTACGGAHGRSGPARKANPGDTFDRPRALTNSRLVASAREEGATSHALVRMARSGATEEGAPSETYAELHPRQRVRDALAERCMCFEGMGEPRDPCPSHPG